MVFKINISHAQRLDLGKDHHTCMFVRHIYQRVRTCTYSYSIQYSYVATAGDLYIEELRNNDAGGGVNRFPIRVSVNTITYLPRLTV
jgi:hypothetical protein